MAMNCHKMPTQEHIGDVERLVLSIVASCAMQRAENRLQTKSRTISCSRLGQRP
jgi:hypothetical protein